MKKLFPYIALLLIVALLIFIRSRFDADEPVESNQATESAVHADEAESATTTVEAALREEPTVGSPEWWRKGYETPMDFYGLVLDQEDRPVPGANIRISWNEYDGDNEVVAMNSDEEGRFSFLGRKGLHLRVNVKKDGYYQIFTEGGSKQNLDFFVPGGEPDNDGNPNHPTLFRLKKQGEGVDLSSHEFSTKMPLNGDFKIDLMNGRISADGELQIKVNRSENKRPYSWDARARITGGGLVKTDDQLKHTAPEDSYLEEVTWSFPLQENGRPEHYTFNETYYVAFGTPRKYGWIRLYLKSDSWHLRFECHVNPDGSRNLEPKK